jgi:hypothetical protein
VTEVPLTRGLVAIVDDEDAHLVLPHKWMASRSDPARSWRASRRVTVEGREITLWMHQVIVGVREWPRIEIDHRDGNGLNNTRANLRIATPSQNRANRSFPPNPVSGLRGVHPLRGRWKAHIRSNGKQRNLGMFDTKEEAAKAYDAAALDAFGEFARLNFPKERRHACRHP